MTAALLAANKLRADVGGLTGRVTRTLPAATSPTEVISALFHGESGNLGFLFDAPVTNYASPTDQRDPVGPHGGAGHSDTAGHIVFKALPPASHEVPAPVVVGQGQEGIGGIF